MLKALEEYLSPKERLGAYIRVILLEAKGVFDETTKDCNQEDVDKATRHCLARSLWLAERHPHDKYLIQQASEHAAQLLKAAVRETVDRNCAAKGSAIKLD